MLRQISQVHNFFSFFLSLVLVSSLVSPSLLFFLTDIYIPLPKIHETDPSRTFLPHMENESSQHAQEASINRYGDIAEYYGGTEVTHAFFFIYFVPTR